MLALRTSEKAKYRSGISHHDASAHVRHFQNLRILPREMSQPHFPDELARLRALVADYEKRLTGAAELMARVRHEINNPLAALLGQAQLLLRGELNDKARKRAETIEGQAKRIEEIVRELRDIQTAPSALNNS